MEWIPCQKTLEEFRAEAWIEEDRPAGFACVCFPGGRVLTGPGDEGQRIETAHWNLILRAIQDRQTVPACVIRSNPWNNRI